MKIYTRFTKLCLISLMLSLSISSSGSAQPPLPDHSVYHIDSFWQDQNGSRFNVTELQGSVRLVAFVYTYCEHTCPVIITKIKSILRDLSEHSQKQTIVTLVTLDPQRDTVERVREYMKSKDLDSDAWQVLVGSPDDVLELSALFDVRYKPMGRSDIAHSNVITLVDQQGLIRHQLRGLSEDSKEMLSLIETLNQL